MSEPARSEADSIADLVRVTLRDFHAPVHVHSRTGSTSDDAKALARAGAPHGTLVVADEQTNGRGRSGSAWFSPPGANLYMSIVIVPSPPSRPPASFALVVGVQIALAIDPLLGCDPLGVDRIGSDRLGSDRRAKIKWPNDIHVRGRKISGVLVEAITRGGETTSLIVGAGVNVSTTTFPEPLEPIATSLAREGASLVDRRALAASIAARTLAAWERYQRDGLPPFMDELRSRDALSGRRVRIEGIEGVACAVADDGRLEIRDDAGERHSVVSGHVEIVD